MYTGATATAADRFGQSAIGSGWNIMNAIVRPGSFNGDRNPTFFP